MKVRNQLVKPRVPLEDFWGSGQGYAVLEKQELAPQIYMFRIAAPAIARKAEAGQFVILRLDETGERIPLTIADWDRGNGDITLVFKEVGGSTTMLSTVEVGDDILDVLGPLGSSTHIEKFGTVVCIGGGVGVAVIAPISRAMKQAGNNVIAILGARSGSLLFWEERLRSFSHRLIVTTDDGSYGRKGVVTEPLKGILEQEPVALVVAIGPVAMMKFCALTAKPFGVRTIASLNAIMVDGTGMCGCCRVTVGDVTKFTCVDGPDFDAHKVDWDLLVSRGKAYADMEEHAAKDCKWRAFERTVLRSRG